MIKIMKLLSIYIFLNLFIININFVKFVKSSEIEDLLNPLLRIPGVKCKGNNNGTIFENLTFGGTSLEFVKTRLTNTTESQIFRVYGCECSFNEGTCQIEAKAGDENKYLRLVVDLELVRKGIIEEKELTLKKIFQDFEQKNIIEPRDYCYVQTGLFISSIFEYPEKDTGKYKEYQLANFKYPEEMVVGKELFPIIFHANAKFGVKDMIERTLRDNGEKNFDAPLAFLRIVRVTEYVSEEKNPRIEDYALRKTYERYQDDQCYGEDCKVYYIKCGPGKPKCPNGTCCSKDGRCGLGTNYCKRGCQSEFGKCDEYISCGSGLPRCPSGSCCSKEGYCGTGPEYCNIKNCQMMYGQCQRMPIPYFPFKCGPDKASCPLGYCCGSDGECGKSRNHCEYGCQSEFGKCNSLKENVDYAECGPGLPKCINGTCCSKDGKCGVGEKYCEYGCQSEFGKCDSLKKNVDYAECGPGLPKCENGTCCSKDGKCGLGEKYCEYGCQSEFGKCDSLKRNKKYAKCGSGLPKCESGTCCGKNGYCGFGNDYCLEGCQKQYGMCLSFNKGIGLLCGIMNLKCPDYMCCGPDGQCGTTSYHCGAGCQPKFGRCNLIVTLENPSESFNNKRSIPKSTNGKTYCGPDYGSCPEGFCCGKDGTCGQGKNYCREGCQLEFGDCD